MWAKAVLLVTCSGLQQASTLLLHVLVWSAWISAVTWPALAWPDGEAAVSSGLVGMGSSHTCDCLATHTLQSEQLKDHEPLGLSCGCEANL